MTLRDEIYSLVMGAVEFRQDAGMAADDIMALFRKAMLSDEAIDGMLARSYGWVDYGKSLTYPDLPEEEKAKVRPEGQHEMLGALDAVLGEGA